MIAIIVEPQRKEINVVDLFFKTPCQYIISQAKSQKDNLTISTVVGQYKPIRYLQLNSTIPVLLVVVPEYLS